MRADARWKGAVILSRLIAIAAVTCGRLPAFGCGMEPRGSLSTIFGHRLDAT
jgi:hypothetical protein